MTSERETLVAWYGSKPEAFRTWLAMLQREVFHAAGPHFVPYDIEQIHSTLIDLGKAHETRDFERWLAKRVPRPVDVLFGGQRELDATLLSRGKPRSERCFSIQRDKVVLIGWSKVAFVGALRRDCETFGYRHPYHTEQELDDDFYLRLGTLSEELDVNERESAERRVRSWLAQHELGVALSLSALKIVRYETETLAPHSSHARAIDHAPPGA